MLLFRISGAWLRRTVPIPPGRYDRNPGIVLVEEFLTCCHGWVIRGAEPLHTASADALLPPYSLGLDVSWSRPASDLPATEPRPGAPKSWGLPRRAAAL